MFDYNIKMRFGKKSKAFTAAAVCAAAMLLFAAVFPAAGVAAYADGFGAYLSLKIGSPNVYNGIYNETYRLDQNDDSVMPILLHDRTMLPMRAFMALLNFDGPDYYDIDWDDDTETAFLFMANDADEDYFEPIAEFQIGNATARYYVGGVFVETEIPVAPELINNRTYLPFRAVIDAITANAAAGGSYYTYTIEWIDAEQGIIIYFGDEIPTGYKLPE